MQSCRKVVSDITSSLRADNIDDRIPTRLVLSTAKDKTSTMIKQDADSRRIFLISEQWKKIDCLPLKEVNFQECGFDVPQCSIMMRSFQRVPEAFQSSYGNMIKLFTLNGLKSFTQTTLHQYKEIKRRQHVDQSVRYFMLIDGYIFIPDSQVEEVIVYGMFKNPHEADVLNGKSNCVPALDQPFPCPDYLVDIVKKETKIELLKIFKGVIVDERPDENSNKKS